MVMDDSSRSRHGRPSTTPVTIPRRKRGCGWNGGPQRGQFVALGSCIPCPACTRSCVCVFSCSLQYEIRWGVWLRGKWDRPCGPAYEFSYRRVFLASHLMTITTFSACCARERREKKKIGGRRHVVGGGGEEACLQQRGGGIIVYFGPLTWRRRWGMGREKRVVAFVSC